MKLELILYLVVEVAGVLPVVLVAAVLCRRALPLHVVAQVVLKDAGEGHGRQHAHHRGQREHQTHHDAGEIHGADGVQGHWRQEVQRRWRLQVVGDAHAEA